MVSTELNELYAKHAPKWFKVIRWRDFAKRRLEMSKLHISLVFAPIAWTLFIWANPYPMYLAIKQPQTDEERLALKRDCFINLSQRDWEIGQYNHGRPPIIDVWKRRKNYPEYYEGKYEGYRRDAVANQQDSLVGSGIAMPTKKVT